MAGKKGAVDKSGAHPNWVMAYDKQPENIKEYSTGVHCGPLAEPMGEFCEAPCETTLKGKNNSYIVLGRDRVTSEDTGYGGKGHTQASMIDLVVGRMASEPKSVDDQGLDIYCHPDPELDAARIYISQKTDADDNFKLADGSIGCPKSRSAVVMKADGVRMIGREGIKLVTRGDRKNSQGGDVSITKGIDLIAGNDDSDLQPMIKGDNLVRALQAMYDEINTLNGIVANLVTEFNTLASDLSTHTHPIPPWPVLIPTPAGPAPLATLAPGALTLPSPPVVAGCTKAIVNATSKCFMGAADQKLNLAVKTFDYLKPSSKNYICSTYNKVN